MYVFKTITSQYLRGNSNTEMRPVEKFPPLIIRRAPEEGHDWLQSTKIQFIPDINRKCSTKTKSDYMNPNHFIFM